MNEKQKELQAKRVERHWNEKIKVYTSELAKTSFVDWVELNGVHYLKVRVQEPSLRANYYFEEDVVDEEFEITRKMTLTERIELMKTSTFLVKDSELISKLEKAKLGAR